MNEIFNRTNTAEERLHSPMREIVVAAKPGAKKASTSMVDPALFKGDNHLYAIMEESGLWTCKYMYGILPEPLKQHFTTVSRLVAHVKDYMDKRDLEVIEVKDHYAS